MWIIHVHMSVCVHTCELSGHISAHFSTAPLTCSLDTSRMSVPRAVVRVELHTACDAVAVLTAPPTDTAEGLVSPAPQF